MTTQQPQPPPPTTQVSNILQEQQPATKRRKLSQPTVPKPAIDMTTITTTTTTTVATGQSPLPLPRVLTHSNSQAPELITQGAEGLLYRTSYLSPSIPCALKYRPPKPYRHPILDARLTKQRILAEARILAKCRREAVPVPAVYCVDEAGGWLMMEWVDGQPVRVGVNAWLGDKSEEEVNRAAAPAHEGDGREGDRGNSDLVGLMRRVGAAVGKLHGAGLVHGDLTTSNMMLRPAARRREGEEDGVPNGHHDEGILDGEIVIIDFGLASQSSSEEDRAVDLYVLERAFLSTHPRAQKLFDEVLNGYKQGFKGAKPALKKLEDVRMRGRKRSMLG